MGRLRSPSGPQFPPSREALGSMPEIGVPVGTTPTKRSDPIMLGAIGTCTTSVPGAPPVPTPSQFAVTHASTGSSRRSSSSMYPSTCRSPSPSSSRYSSRCRSGSIRRASVLIDRHSIASSHAGRIASGTSGSMDVSSSMSSASRSAFSPGIAVEVPVVDPHRRFDLGPAGAEVAAARDRPRVDGRDRRRGAGLGGFGGRHVAASEGQLEVDREDPLRVEADGEQQVGDRPTMVGGDVPLGSGSRPAPSSGPRR